MYLSLPSNLIKLKLQKVTIPRVSFFPLTLYTQSVLFHDNILLILPHDGKKRLSVCSAVRSINFVTARPTRSIASVRFPSASMLIFRHARIRLSWMYEAIKSFVWKEPNIVKTIAPTPALY